MTNVCVYGIYYNKYNIAVITLRLRDNGETMKIALGADDAGRELKDTIKAELERSGYVTEDFGLYAPEKTADYPDYALPAAEAVASGKCDTGILVCGTGIGMSICANKVKGIRCAHVTDCFSAEATRLHNDANMLALGARVTGEGLALKIVKTFLETPYSGAERHTRRINKITAIEKKYYGD